MGIGVKCRLYGFMSQAVSYLQWGKVEFYQHTCVAVPQVVYSDRRQPCLFGCPLYLLFQSGFCKIEDSVSLSESVEL